MVFPDRMNRITEYPLALVVHLLRFKTEFDQAVDAQAKAYQQKQCYQQPTQRTGHPASNEMIESIAAL